MLHSPTFKATTFVIHTLSTQHTVTHFTSHGDYNTCVCLAVACFKFILFSDILIYVYDMMIREDISMTLVILYYSINS